MTTSREDDVRYDKLVRDRIPAILAARHIEAEVRQASHEERWPRLRAKLSEEVAEFDLAQSPTERTEELADVLEVVLALAAADGVSAGDLERVRAVKAMARGGFVDGWILIETREPCA